METKTNASYVDNSSRSNKLPYILAGSAVGGLIGFLVTTNSGKRFINSVRHMDTGELENRIESSREYIENKSRAVTEKVRNVFTRTMDAIDYGRQVYEESVSGPRAPMVVLDRKNTEIAKSVHNTVDGVSRTVKTFGESLLEPIYELSALVNAVRQSVGNLTGKGDDSGMEPIGEPAPYYKRMG